MFWPTSAPGVLEMAMAFARALATDALLKARSVCGIPLQDPRILSLLLVPRLLVARAHYSVTPSSPGIPLCQSARR